MKNTLIKFVVIGFLAGCGKKDSPDPPITPTIKVIAIQEVKLNNSAFNSTYYGSNRQPVIRLTNSTTAWPSMIEMLARMPTPMVSRME